jgi:hypothetical protein
MATQAGFVPAIRVGRIVRQAPRAIRVTHDRLNSVARISRFLSDGEFGFSIGALLELRSLLLLLAFLPPAKRNPEDFDEVPEGA